ncbi:hypothetical protein [Actinoplanes sp. M2I2]|uniref:hypothetical protein n=1 Tax=Actinoplanes sp. M2I2 TaxID=1734444 RepID=UPI002020B73D|nr:hypothetical protein [Actinoplanes sp. M2I2]
MRNAAFRGLALLLAAACLFFPGFGLIDLSETWDPAWPVVLEAGWGLLFTVLLGCAFGYLALSPQRAAPAVIQVLVVSGALALSAAVAVEGPALVIAAVLAVAALVFLGVPGRENVWPRPLVIQRPLAVVATLGVVPWSIYVWQMYEANRAGFAGDDTIGVNHYAVQGALALGVTALACLAAAWPRGRRFIGVCAGLVAAYLGLVSFSWPDAFAAYPRGWSVLSMAWGLAVVALALVRSGRPAR